VAGGFWEKPSAISAASLIIHAKKSLPLPFPREGFRFASGYFDFSYKA